MIEEGQQKTPAEHVEDQQQAEKVARERGGVEKGLGAETVSKYVPEQKVAITEVIANKQKKKKLFIANQQKNPKTKKFEYQLTETKGDTTTLYLNGKWFAQGDVYVA